VKSLEFDPAGFEDLAWWVEMDRKKALRIIKLIKEVQRDPFHGTGNQNP
jgi:toxin YoeB